MNNSEPGRGRLIVIVTNLLFAIKLFFAQSVLTFLQLVVAALSRLEVIVIATGDAT